MEGLEDFLRQVERSAGLEDIQRHILDLRARYGIDHIVYHWVAADGGQYGCGTYDPAWAARYEAQGYLRVDPVIAGCFQHFRPVNWKDLDWSAKAARDFMTDAVAHGVGTQGYSIPIRGPSGQFALFTLNDTCSDDDWRQFCETHRREAILIAHTFNEVALRIEADRAPEPAKTLSVREVETLTFLGLGYGRAQVAAMLEISEHTLRAYIESARLKLGARNTMHAVARAIVEGRIVLGGTRPGAAPHWPGQPEGAPALNGAVTGP